MSQAQAFAHVDHGDDATAQVDGPLDFGGRQRDGGDPVRGQDVLDLKHGDAEHLVLDEEGDEVLQVLSLQGFQLLGAGCRDDLIHGMTPRGVCYCF